MFQQDVKNGCSVILFSLFLNYTFFIINGLSKSDQPIVEYYNFKNTRYVFFSQKVTWEEANMLCSTYDAKLAVLDNMEKASNVAKAISESNIVMEDAWLGARRFNSTWTWTEGLNLSSNYRLSIEPDVDNFPPWAQKPTRQNKECLAINRLHHSSPNFIDLDCRLLRPFICEKNSKDHIDTPLRSKLIQIRNNLYILYHGKLTWSEAVIFCRSQGTRLAVVRNQDDVHTISHAMTKSRPDFENVWIGAHFSYGNWVWLSTGSILNPISNTSGYPPWHLGKSEKNSGCLLLDRHIEKTPNFVDMHCDGKRDFICEDYPPEEAEEWLDEPIKVHLKNETIIIYPLDKTWDESRLYCQKRGSILAYVYEMQSINLLVAAMGDHPKAISHLWLGGLFFANKSEWKWIHDDTFIPTIKDDSGFPPWAQNVVEIDSESEQSACLNLDRSDHAKPHLYGLDCNSKQSFACLMNCEVPPIVNEGNWNCITDNTSLKTCSLNCNKNLLLLGPEKFHCSPIVGWYNKLDWLELPLCLGAKDYLNRMIRSLNQDIKKASGYYFLMSHFQQNMPSISLQFSENLVKMYPLSSRLKMGLTSYITNPEIDIPLDQINTCSALELISSLKSKLITSGKKENKTSDINWFQRILRDTNKKLVIIATIDSETAVRNQQIFNQLRMAGHYVITIGLKEDWESLESISTIGMDQHLNSYVFNNEQEFETIVNELKNIKSRYIKCPQRTSTISLLISDVKSMNMEKENSELTFATSTVIAEIEEKFPNLNTTINVENEQTESIQNQTLEIDDLDKKI